MNEWNIAGCGGEPFLPPYFVSDHVDLPGFSVPESYLLTDSAALLFIPTEDFS